MTSILQSVGGIVLGVMAYNPIAVIISAPFHYGGAPLPGILTVIAVSAIEIAIGVMVIKKKPNYQRLGMGIVVGAITMTLFMFLLTPLLGS